MAEQRKTRAQMVAEMMAEMHHHAAEEKRCKNMMNQVIAGMDIGVYALSDKQCLVIKNANEGSRIREGMPVNKVAQIQNFQVEVVEEPNNVLAQ